LVLSLAEAGLLVVAFLLPLVFVLLAMPPFLRFLVRKGRVVDDVHKKPPTKVPSPAGPILFLGIVVGEVAAYLSFGSLVPVAILGVASVAFAIGVLDDYLVLSGPVKPALLLLAGVPLVLAQHWEGSVYASVITFPILGTTGDHFLTYTALAILGFPIVANAFNMMDSFNGQISWFTLLTSLALLFGVTLHFLFTSVFSPVRVATTLPLVAVAAGFLVFNRYPSKAFDGQTGSLLFGAVFAALAVTGGVEVAAVIAIVPAILNSFYTLSSVRGFVERRKMSRPTYIGEDGRLFASSDPAAPTTLVRLVLLGGPRSEQGLVKDIVTLALVSCILSVVISVLTWGL
jgi:UDP-N-acetylmuramyl pentapeptide phosphotransferase/UDP-N-acetylglucosamine-1-phosphate transferase